MGKEFEKEKNIYPLKKTYINMILNKADHQKLKRKKKSPYSQILW